MQPTAVIKYGGHAMEHDDLATAFARDIAERAALREPTVLVHGGGPQINALLRQLHIESQFVNGLRKTDQQTMDAVEMVLAGTVNKAVVSMLARNNVPAVGISGRDGNLLRCTQKDPALGFVGDITHVSPELLNTLLAANFVPVVAPLANGPANEAYNINADTAAGAIAGALHAEFFVLISDVPGVLDDRGTLLPQIDRKTIQTMIAEGVITGGMIPKVESCLHALDAGTEKALILDGRQPSSLSRFLHEKEPLGTVVLR